jgi:hypothetical protein
MTRLARAVESELECRTGETLRQGAQKKGIQHRKTHVVW